MDAWPERKCFVSWVEMSQLFTTALEVKCRVCSGCRVSIRNGGKLPSDTCPHIRPSFTPYTPSFTPYTPNSQSWQIPAGKHVMMEHSQFQISEIWFSSLQPKLHSFLPISLYTACWPAKGAELLPARAGVVSKGEEWLGVCTLGGSIRHLVPCPPCPPSLEPEQNPSSTFTQIQKFWILGPVNQGI